MMVGKENRGQCYVIRVFGFRASHLVVPGRATLRCNFFFFLFKILDNKSPNYLFTLFSETSIIHSHNTRKRFFIPSIKTNNGKKSFKYFGPYIWNNIPNSSL